MLSEWKQTTTVKQDGRIEVIVPDLRQGQTVEVLVTFDQPNETRPRRPGTARGKIRIHPDFDQPLPEFEEYT
jgi:hypothetical protein